MGGASPTSGQVSPWSAPRLAPLQAWPENPCGAPEPPAASGGVAAGEESVAFPNPGLCTHLLIPVFGEMSHCSQSRGGGGPWAPGVCSRAVMAQLSLFTTRPSASPGPGHHRTPPLHIQAWPARGPGVGTLSSPGTLSVALHSQNLAFPHVPLAPTWKPAPLHVTCGCPSRPQHPLQGCRALSLRCSHGHGSVLTGRSWGKRAPWWPPESGALRGGACPG